MHEQWTPKVTFTEFKSDIPAFLKGHVTRFFALSFFYESSSPKPLKITLGSFQIFSKILGDIRKSRCNTGIKDTGGKFWRLKIFFHLPPVQCQGHHWCTSSCEYLREFSKKIETTLVEYSGAWGKLNQEKTWSRQSRDTVPLKGPSSQARISWPRSKIG